MSSNVFPALPTFARDYSREPDYATDVRTTISDKEQTTVWASTPRLDYRVRWTGLRSNVPAPAPWAAYSEIAILNKFYDDHFGDGDSFLWVDPYTNTQVRVRFVRGSLHASRVLGPTGGIQLWAAEARWIQVKT